MQAAKANGDITTARADIETEYLERADEPLRKQELTTKAFNVMWIDFFKLFSAVAAAASLYVSVKTLRQGEWEMMGFHLISMLMFAAGRQWLASADVVMHDPRGIFGPLDWEFQLFFGLVLMQLLTLPLMHFSGHPPTKWSKAFPSGMVFASVGLAVVAYMRLSLRRTIKYRAELQKKLFG